MSILEDSLHVSFVSLHEPKILELVSGTFLDLWKCKILSNVSNINIQAE